MPSARAARCAAGGDDLSSTLPALRPDAGTAHHVDAQAGQDAPGFRVGHVFRIHRDVQGARRLQYRGRRCAARFATCRPRSRRPASRRTAAAYAAAPPRELLRQPAHADMRAKFRHHPRQRGDLLVAFDQAVSIDFQEQPGRQRALLGQQQASRRKNFWPRSEGGDAHGQLTFVRGQPLQVSATACRSQSATRSSRTAGG